jgi:hypothetical protein
MCGMIPDLGADSHTNSGRKEVSLFLFKLLPAVWKSSDLM